MPAPIFNRRVSAIEESITLAVTAKASEMKSKGIDVVSMSAGEPDFDTPDHIKYAAIKAITEGFTKYTPVGGTMELRKAVAEKFARENGLTYAANQTLVSIGGKHSCYLAVAALVDDGDEVLIPAPYWVSHPDMVLLAGGKPVIMETSTATGLKITPDQLRKAITPRTKLIIINSPSNPSGAVYTKDELVALGDVLKGTGVFVLSDEIYEHLIYEGEHHSIAAVVPELSEQTIVANGVAKAYAMTGWRIGYAAGPKSVIGAMAKIQSQQTSNAVSISQKATLAALTGPQDHLVPWKEEYRTRRNYIVERLNAIPGVLCPTPAGAFYVFPDVSSFYGKSFGGRVIEDSVALTDYLLEEFHVACVPGSGFGAPRHIRLSYATSMAAITKAMDRIEKGLTTLS